MEQEGYFFETQSLTGRKKQTKISNFADITFEIKVLRTLCNVCLFIQITSDYTGTEYCKPCTFAK